MALGQPAGTLAAGHRADLVELDKDHPLLEGVEGDAVLDTWLFGGDSDMIRSVRVGGKLLVQEGRHIREDDLDPAWRRALRELRS